MFAIHNNVLAKYARSAVWLLSAFKVLSVVEVALVAAVATLNDPTQGVMLVGR